MDSYTPKNTRGRPYTTVFSTTSFWPAAYTIILLSSSTFWNTYICTPALFSLGHGTSLIHIIIHMHTHACICTLMDIHVCRCLQMHVHYPIQTDSACMSVTIHACPCMCMYVHVDGWLLQSFSLQFIVVWVVGDGVSPGTFRGWRACVGTTLLIHLDDSLLHEWWYG